MLTLELPPSIAPSRRVPFAIKPKLKVELERLTGICVLMPVDEPTNWVSNLVIATKESGDLRLCLDLQQLNKALKRESYPLPVIDDILPHLSRAKVFTKIDARNGYWHVQLDDQLCKLTTFDTPYRRYRWKRLPFVVSVASEIFQKRLTRPWSRRYRRRGDLRPQWKVKAVFTALQRERSEIKQEETEIAV